MMATPDAMISRDVEGKAIRMTMNVINSTVPIQDNIAPDLTIICKLNQLRKSKP
ncbi:MAG: hypothetical protein K0S67_2121 [Nitrososphaeraceae archaeon]|nr:hypothetical protein [Nitrososphaeraceae archaeon]